ncbi:PDZ domain-containing protein [Tuwongella immobilis]|uniref:PDZ domain-containing protein n=1 Tax=Tuwongella immobilis TaxID=692036 RepID=A0A6C2YJI4_9BACT|nr:PDZ domain-containing protein [Tuwongella immobilis]VIP01730.1 trypsin-like serine protease with c-terminal pdz domain : Trypsin-like serine protease with C-terminal PDZ domain OS=Singulisphaera acidiphila (strain ATCC BAA-1392 / DSM 18658 / VKM B-2454 / MOB10) GN=Sinac_0130 PE=4 SV=1: Asp_protease_2: PDZ_2 [Tuwongella immobilis]VTR99278.1 trypsin-like serine protease with c-terminal pdz domain : Trypsin-like serine protease with C-terminal PDZ domain OS=Singulisphaera acidiphila (strain ATCC 
MNALSLTLAVILSTPAAPPMAAATEKKPATSTPTIEVPYRLTDTMHILVRAKINGKGPFNFILDTGAPAMILNQATGEKIGLKPDRDSWASLDRLQLEGGLEIPKAKLLMLDMFQLKGMNGLGLAGVELHGVIGYNLLARYRIQYDFTQDKLKWQPLDFTPPPLRRIAKGESSGGQGASLEMLGSVMAGLGGMGLKASTEVRGRGFLGIEVESIPDGGVKISSILPESPAAKAGLQVGDQLKQIKKTAIDTPRDVLKALATIPAGESVEITVERAGKSLTQTAKFGRGF